MDVDVGFRGTVGIEDASALEQLAADLHDADLTPESTRIVVPGIKDGGLTVGIALAGLALSALNTVISAVGLWLRERPKYSATIRRGGVTYAISGVDQQQLLTLSAALREEGEGLPLSVTLSTKE